VQSLTANRQRPRPPARRGYQDTFGVAERNQFEGEIASVPALGIPRNRDQAPTWISVQQGVEPSLESATLLVGHGLMPQVLWNMN